MVHAFDVDGRYFALDADSGAVHMLDKMGFDAVSAIQSDGWDKARETCERAYGKGETEELFADIRSLQEQGLLFSYDAQLHCPPEGLGKPTVLKAMCLHVAHDCNLRCRYCFAGTGAFHGQRLLMPLEVGQKAIDMLIARSGNRKFLELDFFGGEPLMNFDVVKQLVAYGKERAAERGKTIRFTLTTNAYALTDEIIDFLNREMETWCSPSTGARRSTTPFVPRQAAKAPTTSPWPTPRSWPRPGANKSITCAAPLPATTWTLPTT